MVVKLTVMVALKEMRSDGGRREVGKEYINHNAQEIKQHNPDDLNTRFIQINNQPFFIDNGALL